MENVLCVCCTYGRHSCLERVVYYFLEQDYEGPHTLLIYNSSPVWQQLDPEIVLPANKKIILINWHLDKKTGKPYDNVGAKYRDAVGSVKPGEYEVFTSMDDDDLYLPDHISEGVAGCRLALLTGDKAYKPHYSYYRTTEGISKVHNTLEPSIFVSMDHILEYGFAEVPVEYHQRWLNPLVENNQILVDLAGKPTFVYNWVGEVFKISGDPDNPKNMENHSKNSTDHGDRIITPKEFKIDL